MASMLQALIGWLIPRETSFFDFLEQQAATAHEGVVALAAFTRNGATAQSVRERVQAREHEGDAIVHAMEEALARTFVTPIDREDIQKLSSELDDILDLTNAAARACVLMGVEQPTEPMKLLVDKLQACTDVLSRGIPLLRAGEYGKLLGASRELRGLEKEGDAIYREAVRALFLGEQVDARVLLREEDRARRAGAGHRPL